MPTMSPIQPRSVTLPHDHPDSTPRSVTFATMLWNRGHRVTKIRRKKYVAIHGRLHQAWDDYEEEKLTTTDLLRIISHINALGPSTAVHHMLDDDKF
ncbi:hypothetical protein DPMN_182102 [Dreissena polymorpha]|uniref:Uncharacterized protein n=1 Tax=Dreissena polymorpha TaxID=45954 RepID=A0A9D4DF76_DREPO|nr:hypothetical protein DPMN_182102 [Dreissena polymorpha]